MLDFKISLLMGLLDGQIYDTIHNSLIGIQLEQPDEYAAFQSDLCIL